MRLATPSLSALLLLFVCAGARAQQTMQMVWNFPTSAPCNAPALWHDELAGPAVISAARTAQLEAFKGSWAELSTWVYVACSDGTLSSLNTTTSQVGWSTQLGTGSIVTDPALSNDGYIYVGTASGNVFKVDTLDGSVQWNQTLGTGIAQQSAISLGGNGLVVGIENGHTLFLSLADGSVVSTATGSTIANPTPIIYNGLVAHSDAGQVWVDTSSALTLLYKYIHGTGNFHRVLGLGKNFYAPNDGGTIYVFDAQSGATVRKIQCTTTKPLLYSQGNVVAVTTDGSAVAFSEATGGLSWTAPSNTYTSPAVVSANVPAIGLLYVGTSAGVSALNATDGSVVATFATNTPVTRPPGVQYGVGDVYLSTQRGIYRLRPPTV